MSLRREPVSCRLNGGNTVFFPSEKSLRRSVKLKVEGFLRLRFSCGMIAGIGNETVF